MEDVSELSMLNIKDSAYMKLRRIMYKQNGKSKIWDCIKVHDSVSVLLYNETTKCILLVKQFRPENIDVSKYPSNLGITLELCGGILDKDKTLEEIACDEVLEECGYSIQPENLELIVTYKSGVGISGSTHTVFFAKVNEQNKKTLGNLLMKQKNYC